MEKTHTIGNQPIMNREVKSEKIKNKMGKEAKKTTTTFNNIPKIEKKTQYSQNVPFNHKAQKMATPTQVLKKEVVSLGDKDPGKMQAVGKQLAATRVKNLPSPCKMPMSQFHEYLSVEKLTLPKSFENIPNTENINILWRGVTPDRLVLMLVNESAGKLPCDPKTPPPTEEEVKSQVGEKASFPEFTEIPQIAQQFGKRGLVVAFAIPERYLVEGSKSEGGFVCGHSAPALLVGWKDSFTSFF